jgi:hypothetical protein
MNEKLFWSLIRRTLQTFSIAFLVSEQERIFNNDLLENTREVFVELRKLNDVLHFSTSSMSKDYLKLRYELTLMESRREFDAVGFQHRSLDDLPCRENRADFRKN